MLGFFFFSTYLFILRKIGFAYLILSIKESKRLQFTMLFLLV